jgi:hypothetical protein
MSKMLATNRRHPPEAFSQYSRARFERTVQLTEKAIAKLEAQSQTVTLMAVCEATREFDADGKGLQPNTILRNSAAADLFRQHSPAYQARQRQATRVKRKRPKIMTHADVRAQYRGLRISDLIQLVEDLKAQLMELKSQQERLRTERDEAYRLREQALQQNTRQLIALAKLTPRTQQAGESR